MDNATHVVTSPLYRTLMTTATKLLQYFRVVSSLFLCMPSENIFEDHLPEPKNALDHALGNEPVNWDLVQDEWRGQIGN